MEITGLSETDVMAIPPAQINGKKLDTTKQTGETAETNNNAAAVKAVEEKEKNEPLNEAKLQADVDKINQVVELYNEELHFTLHKDSGQVMVEVINRETQEVIKEIPPKKFLDWVGRFHAMLGAMFDKTI